MALVSAEGGWRKTIIDKSVAYVICYAFLRFLPIWDCPDGQRSTVNVRQAIQICTITLATCSTKVLNLLSSFCTKLRVWPPQRARSRLLNLISLLLENETVHDFWLICFSSGQNLHRSMESLRFGGLFRAFFLNNPSGSFIHYWTTAICWTGIYKQPRRLLSTS